MIVTMSGSTLLIRSEMRNQQTFVKSGCFDHRCTVDIAEYRDDGQSYLRITHGDEALTIPNERDCQKEFISWASTLHPVDPQPAASE